MIARELLARLRSAALPSALRVRRIRLTGHTRTYDPGHGALDHIGREWLQREAAIHDLLAFNISWLMERNIAKRENLREQWARIEHEGVPPGDDPLAGQATEQASLRDDIEALDRIIARQVRLIDRHLIRASCLHERAARTGEPALLSLIAGTPSTFRILAPLTQAVQVVLSWPSFPSKLLRSSGELAVCIILSIQEAGPIGRPAIVGGPIYGTVVP